MTCSESHSSQLGLDLPACLQTCAPNPTPDGHFLLDEPVADGVWPRFLWEEGAQRWGSETKH